MRIRTALTAALLIAASLTFGQGSGHEGHHPKGLPAKSSDAMGGMDMAACMRDMGAAQKKLDSLVAKMNGTQGADRIDATSAVINELVDEHRKMMEMCHMMMASHGGMMGGTKGHRGSHKGTKPTLTHNHNHAK